MGSPRRCAVAIRSQRAAPCPRWDGSCDRTRAAVHRADDGVELDRLEPEIALAAPARAPPPPPRKGGSPSRPWARRGAGWPAASAPAAPGPAEVELGVALGKAGVARHDRKVHPITWPASCVKRRLSIASPFRVCAGVEPVIWGSPFSRRRTSAPTARTAICWWRPGGGPWPAAPVRCPHCQLLIGTGRSRSAPSGEPGAKGTAAGVFSRQRRATRATRTRRRRRCSRPSAWWRQRGRASGAAADGRLPAVRGGGPGHSSAPRRVRGVRKLEERPRQRRRGRIAGTLARALRG